MSSYAKFTNDMEARRLVEAKWPQAKLEICDSKKCGEYNMLHCVREKGHAGEHSYVVDHVNDYPHNKREAKR